MAEMSIIPCEHGRYSDCPFKDCDGPLRVKAETLFEQAEQERDRAMAAVDEAADEQWKEHADLFIHEYARTHKVVHVDDLWDAGLEEPKSPRALGPRMLAAARSGWITKTDRVRPSVRSHLTGKPIWISNIYEE